MRWTDKEKAIMAERRTQDLYAGPNPYPATPLLKGMVNVLIAVFIIALVIALLIRVVKAEIGRNEWLCPVSDSTALGTVAKWDTRPGHYGWVDMPADLQPFADPLYADRDIASAYMLYISMSRREVWVIPIADLNYVSTDSNGEHLGQHDNCDVHIYPLPEE